MANLTTKEVRHIKSMENYDGIYTCHNCNGKVVQQFRIEALAKSMVEDEHRYEFMCEACENCAYYGVECEGEDYTCDDVLDKISEASEEMMELYMDAAKEEIGVCSVCNGTGVVDFVTHCMKKAA